jgi:hypothetical protein
MIVAALLGVIGGMLAQQFLFPSGDTNNIDVEPGAQIDMGDNGQSTDDGGMFGGIMDMLPLMLMMGMF